MSLSSHSTETVSDSGAPPFGAEDIPPEISNDKSEEDAFKVSLDDSENPQCLPPLRKWIIVIVICSAAACVTCASSLVRPSKLSLRLFKSYGHFPKASFTEDGVSKEFRVSHEVAILSVSLFVEGLGLGPLLMGPLSEVWGRTPIYRVSYALLAVLSFPVVFAPNAGQSNAKLPCRLPRLTRVFAATEVYLVFRFFTGFCGSAFLSVAGGSVSDLFTNAHVAKYVYVSVLLPESSYSISPMALFSISPVSVTFRHGFVISKGFSSSVLFWVKQSRSFRGR